MGGAPVAHASHHLLPPVLPVLAQRLAVHVVLPTARSSRAAAVPQCPTRAHHAKLWGPPVSDASLDPRTAQALTLQYDGLCSAATLRQLLQVPAHNHRTRVIGPEHALEDGQRPLLIALGPG